VVSRFRREIMEIQKFMFARPAILPCCLSHVTRQA
jgi:hypothetical protein